MKRANIHHPSPPDDLEKDKGEDSQNKEDSNSDGVYRNEDAGALPAIEDPEEAEDEV